MKIKKIYTNEARSGDKVVAYLHSNLRLSVLVILESKILTSESYS